MASKKISPTLMQIKSLEEVDANALFRTDANGNSVNWWQGIEVQDIIDVKVSFCNNFRSFKVLGLSDSIFVRSLPVRCQERRLY